MKNISTDKYDINNNKDFFIDIVNFNSISVKILFTIILK